MNNQLFPTKSWKRLQHADLLKVKEIRREATMSFDALEISLDAAGAASLSALFILKARQSTVLECLWERLSKSTKCDFSLQIDY